MSKVICIGSACKDIFFPTGEGIVTDTPKDILSQKKITFELGAKYKIEERAEALGGCAANVAVGMSRLGVETACYSHLGDDENSHWIEKQLKADGVGIDLLTYKKDFPGDLSAIVVDKASGERVIFSNQKVNGELEIEEEKVKNAEWFFVGDLHGDWEKKLDTIYEIAKNNNVKIANNPRQANLHDNPRKILEIIPATRVLFLNKDEAMEILGASEKRHSFEELKKEKFLLEEFKNMGPDTVVITDGERGAWAIDGKNFIHADALKVKAVDTTGAGDSFTASFLAAYIKGKNLEECLCWGIANSSSEVQFYGSIEGLLDEVGVNSKIKNIKTKFL